VTVGQVVTWNPFNKRIALLDLQKTLGQQLTVTAVRELHDFCSCGAGQAELDSHHGTCYVRDEQLQLRCPLVRVDTNEGEKEFSHLCFVPV
jgi:hypothetical protein